MAESVLRERRPWGFLYWDLDTRCLVSECSIPTYVAVRLSSSEARDVQAPEYCRTLYGQVRES